MGVLRNGEMLIEDRAAREEVRSVRHPFGKVVAHDCPREGIGEDVQHERTACGTVSDRDRRTDDEVVIGGELRRLSEAEKVRGCDGKRRFLIETLRLYPQLLEVNCTEHGQDGALPRGKMNLCLAGGTFAADEIEREVSAEIVGEVLRMADVIEQPCLISLLFLLRVDTDIVRREIRGALREKLAHERCALSRQPLLRAVGHTGYGDRGKARLAHRDGETVKELVGEYLRRNALGCERAFEQLCHVRLHDERVRIAPLCHIGTREHLPCGVLDGAGAEGTFAAEGSRLRIAVCEEIMCCKDIGVHCITVRLPIGGEKGEIFLVIGIAFHAYQKLLKERIGAAVVLPKCTAIVCHDIPSLALIVLISLQTSLFVRHASTARIRRCLQCSRGMPVHADRRMRAARDCPRCMRYRAHVRAQRCSVHTLRSQLSRLHRHTLWFPDAGRAHVYAWQV